MSSIPAKVGPVAAGASGKSCAESCAPETAALVRWLYLHTFRHGMMPALVLMTGLSESQIRRQLTGAQHPSAVLVSVLLATMDRREADHLREQHDDAARVRVRAELVSLGVRQLDLFGRRSPAETKRPPLQRGPRRREPMKTTKPRRETRYYTKADLTRRWLKRGERRTGEGEVAGALLALTATPGSALAAIRVVSRTPGPATLTSAADAPNNCAANNDATT